MPRLGIVLLALLALGASCDGKLPAVCPDGKRPVVVYDDEEGKASLACPSPGPSPSAAPPSAPPTTQPPPTTLPPSPCVPTPQGIPCVTKIDGLPAPNCEPCRDSIAHALASGALDLCTDGKPGACAGAKDRAYNVVSGTPEGRDCQNTKTCDLVWCSTGELRAYRYQRDGSVCDPPGCSKTAVPATPCPAPTVRPPTPPPTHPTPMPSPQNAELDAWGNLPLPPAGECWSPDVIARFGPVIAEYGVSLLHQRKCSGREAPPDCWINNVHTTPKSFVPFCAATYCDENGVCDPARNQRRKCETLRACQPRPFVNNEGESDFIGLFIAHPQWNNVWGECDKRTSGFCDPAVRDCRNNYICHDQAVGRAGTSTGIMACPPGVAPGGPGCTQNTYDVPRMLGARPDPSAEEAVEPGIPTRPRRFAAPHRPETEGGNR